MLTESSLNLLIMDTRVCAPNPIINAEREVLQNY